MLILVIIYEKSQRLVILQARLVVWGYVTFGVRHAYGVVNACRHRRSIVYYVFIFIHLKDECTSFCEGISLFVRYVDVQSYEKSLILQNLVEGITDIKGCNKN